MAAWNKLPKLNIKDFFHYWKLLETEEDMTNVKKAKFKRSKTLTTTGLINEETGQKHGVIRSVIDGDVEESTYLHGVQHGLSRFIDSDRIIIYLTEAIAGDNDIIARLVFDHNCNIQKRGGDEPERLDGVTPMNIRVKG